MATRMYFHSDSPSGISPTPNSAWGDITGAVGSGPAYWQGLLVPEPSHAHETAVVQETEQVTSSQPRDVLNAQYVSDPLPAGTLNGTFKLLAFMYLTPFASALDAFMQVTISVVSGNGTVLRGTAYAGATNTSTGGSGTNNQSLSTSISTRIHQGALSSVNIQEGDRIVVEIGRRSLTAATGSSSAVALQAAEFDGSVDVPSRQSIGQSSNWFSWIEFSADIFGTLTQEMFRMSGGPILNSSVALPFCDVDKVSGLDSADVPSSLRSREGAHGAYLTSEFESSRTIVLEGTVYTSPTSMETYLDKLKASFAPSRWSRPFYFGTDAGTRMVFGKAQGFRYDKDSLRRTGKARFQVTIICEDPRIYSASYTETEHFGFNATTLTVNLTVGGNRDTYPLIFFHGTVNQPTITVDNAYGKMQLAGIDSGSNIASNGVLMINPDTRTMILVGTGNVRQEFSLGWNWIPFSPGNNRIRVSGTTGSTGSVRFIYRDAWR